MAKRKKVKALFIERKMKGEEGGELGSETEAEIGYRLTTPKTTSSKRKTREPQKSKRKDCQKFFQKGQAEKNTEE